MVQAYLRFRADLPQPISFLSRVAQAAEAKETPGLADRDRTHSAARQMRVQPHPAREPEKARAPDHDGVRSRPRRSQSPSQSPRPSWPRKLRRPTGQTRSAAAALTTPIGQPRPPGRRLSSNARYPTATQGTQAPATMSIPQSSGWCCCQPVTRPKAATQAAPAIR